MAGVHREHKRRKHVTLQLLHFEYKQAQPDGWGHPVLPSLPSLTWRHHVVRCLEYAAGEGTFVDFAADTVPVIDAEAGRTRRAQVFVSGLGAIGYLYAEATRAEDLASWLGAHVRAVQFYAGAHRDVVPDYVPGHIIGLLWPTGVCGRGSGPHLESSPSG